MVQWLKEIYDHTFKNLLKARCQSFFMSKSWVAENPEIGIFP